MVDKARVVRIADFLQRLSCLAKAVGMSDPEVEVALKVQMRVSKLLVGRAAETDFELMPEVLSIITQELEVDGKEPPRI